ncbi:fimbrial protein [Providencia heimbachae]|uniref:PapA family protein n=1 Tax=Providencia heimbachae ATCC 35613 TaxID=1354272 RepID=A0A1B7JWI6_9GAMM|nr:fimbrial protein [Providencia heimbachae]OAT52271.1 PapA family protein [Providencia heimbachae ATCC 35613]QCJ71519.1 type 1 fimbrial protein [Providencia heimbachae]SQH15124.1 Major MR/P fimbria protein precursor [Providencia heimbachae]
MKLNKLALVLGFGLAVAAGSAAANQGSGVVTFEGTIIDAPCSISPSSEKQNVPLGSIATSLLNAGGSSTPRPFQLELEQCDIATLKTVTTTFTGVPSPIKTGSLAINGVGKNAAVVITDVGGNQIKLGEKTAEQTLLVGSNTLRFAAYLQGDAANPAVPGKFDAVATFALTYQ